jgi:DNA-binding NtrC family response regulator
VRRAPSHSLLGPALLLYLVADAAAAQGQLDLLGALVAALAGLLSLSALRMARSELAGSQRVGWLGLATACALLRQVAPAGLSLIVDLAQALACGACAALIADLALTVPDRFGSVLRSRLLRGASYGLGALAALLGAAAQAPHFSALGGSWLLPAWLSLAPFCALGFGLGLALLLRALRRRMGSSPAALASNAWALLGLAPAAAVAALVAISALLGIDTTAAPLRAAIAVAAGALLWGHLRLCDPSRRSSVGPTTRDAVAGVLTLAALAVASTLLRPLWPEGPVALAAALIALLLLAAALYRALRELARVVLAPAAGRLLLALERGHLDLAEASDLLDLGRIVLGVARSASGSPASEPLLYLLDPELELRIDAAGQAHSAAVALHPELRAALRDRPGEIVLRLPLEAQIVRKPALRPLIELLCKLDALCVLPLLQRGELEGALCVPLGSRESSLTLEEIEALHRFGRHVAGFLGVLCAEARAFARGSEAAASRDRAEQQLAHTRHELQRSQAEVRALRARDAGDGLDAAAIAYSPSTRALLARLEQLAAASTPVLLSVEHGLPLAPLARLLHHAGGRAERPLVIARCASVRADEGVAALLGSPASADPGWLPLAGDGTLLLCDLPALDPEAQRVLAASMLQSGARVVASCRRDPDALVAEGALLPELRARFGTCVRVPPLRERVEDLASLLLLALDQAARVLGRPPVGLEPDAQARLVAYDWPGNLDELYAVVERAVARCEGSRVTLRELPALGAQPGNPLDGTLERVERRVLQRALERTSGNKSEAARLLGLPRTTFLDKLRRYGLDEGQKRGSGAAPN